MSVSSNPIPPLTCPRADGKPYERAPRVMAAISSRLDLTQSELIAELDDCPNEAIVFFIGQTRRGDQNLYGRLTKELSRRITRMARNRVYGLDRLAVEEIPLKVEIEILELVLAEKPSLDSEFLQVAFGQAVERRTIDAIRKHKHSFLGGRRGWLPTELDEDGEEIERPIELAPDYGPNPEDFVLKLDEKNERHRLLRIACQAVEDKRALMATIMHHAHGWPMQSNDPNKPDLASYFNVTPRQIEYWIEKSLKIMREALGVKI